MQFNASPIDFKRQLLVFVHIPKTAGTAFLRAFDERLGPGRRLETRMEKIDKIHTGPLAARLSGAERALRNALHSLAGIEPLLPRGTRREVLDEIVLLSGHVALGHEPKTKRAPVYLTLVRDPVERFISHYYYLHDLARPERGRRDRQLARIYSLEDYVDGLTAGSLHGPTNVQCLFLAGRESFAAAREIVDERVFLAAPPRRLDQVLELVSRVCGFGPIVASRANVGETRQSAEPVSPRTMAKIGALVEEDRKLFDHVAQEFERVYSRFKPQG